MLSVAAAVLMIGSSAALAQSGTSPASDAAKEVSKEVSKEISDLNAKIDAGIPRPEQVELPPLSTSDFKAEAATAETSAPAAASDTPSAPAAATAAAPVANDEPSTTASTPPAQSDAAKPVQSATTTPGATDAPAAAEKPAPETATAPDSATSQPAVNAAGTDAKPADATNQASSVASADQPVADQLRDLLASKASRYFDRKDERAAVEAFYQARNYAPLWTEGGAISARAKSVITHLKNAAVDGLDPADYPVPDFAAATAPETLAEHELRLTESMLDYTRHAQAGRMHFTQVANDIQYPAPSRNPADIIARVAEAADPAAVLDSFQPQHKAYHALKAKLAELRGSVDKQLPRIEEGPLLRYTANNLMDDPRVPVLRERLGVSENPAGTSYDVDVANAVRKFQRENGLGADGVLGARTVSALNTPKRDNQIDILTVNMERWRWLPHQLGEPKLGNAHVILNIPNYTLRLKQGDTTVWKTKVIVGKPGRHATPLITDAMKYITVNPTWNVPPSIIYNEYLPALQQDPTVLDRMGMKLVQRADGSVHISQPPGDQNALGRLRFNFPNKFLVYMHDTPTKHLFGRDARAFSHGCMRVQNPDQYAAALLNIALPNQHYTAERIRGMYGAKESNINFPTPIPVHLTYQTAFVDEAGELQLRSDIYGHDRKMISLKKGSGNKNLEAIVAHAQPNYSRPRVTLPQGVNGADDRRGPAFNSGPNFLEALFGGFSQPRQPQRVDRRPIYTR